MGVGESEAGGHDVPDKVRLLVHEIRSMLDGSLRWLSLAARGLPELGESPERDEVDRARRQLEHVREALLHMGEVVEAAGRWDGASDSARTAHRSLVEGVTLRAAIEHAAAVVRPQAAELGVTIGITAEPGVGGRRAGAMYSLILNGLRNALESIAQVTGGQPGEGVIEVTLRERPGPGGRPEAELTIADDGVGPPMLDDGRSVFDVGYSTWTGRGGVRGLGLAFCRSLVSELGGTIVLDENETGNERRPGAVLRAVWPLGRGDDWDRGVAGGSAGG